MNILKSVFICSFILFTPFLVFSQISSERELAIDSVFQKNQRVDWPGCAVAIMEHGKIIFSKGYGMADLERDIPVRSNTVFYAGSLAKQFVAAAALLLEEDGKLDLSKNLRNYLPDFPAYGEDIKISDLIHHQSGIKDYFQIFEEKGLNYLDEISMEKVYALIKEEPGLEFSPGEEFSYSNSGYLILSMIIEKISGETLGTFIDKRIFQPLKMKDSRFVDNSEQIIKRRALGYRKNVYDKIENMTMRFRLVGSGGMYTTVEDLARWDDNLNEPVIGSSDFLSKFLKTATLNNGRDTRYAFGIRRDSFRGLPVIGHSGSLGGYRTQYLRFPDQQFSIAIMCNMANCKPGERAHDIAGIFLSDVFTR